MNWQDAFNLSFAALAFIGGWLLKTLWQEIKLGQARDQALAEELAAVKLLVAGSYVSRSEYRDDLRNINEALLRIEHKLDSKQDKEARR